MSCTIGVLQSHCESFGHYGECHEYRPVLEALFLRIVLLAFTVPVRTSYIRLSSFL